MTMIPGNKDRDQQGDVANQQSSDPINKKIESCPLASSPENPAPPAPKISPKIQKQMPKRGWTEESLDKTIKNPHHTVKTEDNRHLPGGGTAKDPATAYINEDGSYVVMNDKTGDVVQVSNRNDPNWMTPF